jgi:mRNA interferase YafQ
MMITLDIRRSTQFKKDLKKVIKQRKNLTLLEDIVQKLRHLEQLESKHRDHLLVGDWSGHRECHINPDWLLIYKVDEELELLRLMRTGSHSDLFR